MLNCYLARHCVDSRGTVGYVCCVCGALPGDGDGLLLLGEARLSGPASQGGALSEIRLLALPARLMQFLKAETQSSRTARIGCGCLFKYVEVYATVCTVEISSRIVQLLRPSFNALE